MSGGKSSRTKGAVGQRIAADMLRDRDWVVDQITAGIAAADLIATDPDGRVYACEVKNTAALLPSHIKQARGQAQKRQKAWMLAWHIPGTSSWLVQRQGALPVVWHQKGGECES